jgi:hypothetical protein
MKSQDVEREDAKDVKAGGVGDIEVGGKFDDDTVIEHILDMDEIIEGIRNLDIERLHEFIERLGAVLVERGGEELEGLIINHPPVTSDPVIATSVPHVEAELVVQGGELCRAIARSTGNRCTKKCSQGSVYCNASHRCKSGSRFCENIRKVGSQFCATCRN